MTKNLLRLVPVILGFTAYCVGWLFPLIGVQLWGSLISIIAWPESGNTELMTIVLRPSAYFLLVLFVSSVLVIVVRNLAIFYSLCISLGVLTNLFMLFMLNDASLIVLRGIWLEILFYILVLPSLTILLKKIPGQEKKGASISPRVRGPSTE